MAAPALFPGADILPFSFFPHDDYFPAAAGSTDPNMSPGFDISDYILNEEQHFPPAPFSDNAASSSSTAARSPITPAARSTAPVRPRTERIAFRVQSEVEILNDGFRWRKYGKKSVKNSPNPRNYYRCSTEGCGVKKRVERDKEDDSYVITTYEGVHNHVCPSALHFASQDAISGRYFIAGQLPPTSSSS